MYDNSCVYCIFTVENKQMYANYIDFDGKNKWKTNPIGASPMRCSSGEAAVLKVPSSNLVLYLIVCFVYAC